jgi:protocatechuate 3,4-dioxygenase beta subunit
MAPPMAGQLVAIAGVRTSADAHGNYEFDGLAPNNYHIALGAVSPAGFTCPTAIQTVQVLQGRTSVLNFVCPKS